MLISYKHNLMWEPDGYMSDLQLYLINQLEFIEKKESDDNFRSLIVMTNPYQKVLDLYMNKVLPSHTPIYKDKMGVYCQRFRKWISKMFLCEKLIVSLRFENSVEENTKILTKYKFSRLNYDFIIRDFKLESDLKKIKEDFLLDDFKLEYKWDIKSFYDFQTAKIIFNFYKNEFYIGGYDPFSFSNVNLEKYERVKFLHESF